MTQQINKEDAVGCSKWGNSLQQRWGV